MIEQIEQDLKTALMAGDKTAVSTLRLLKSALGNARIQKGGELDEAEQLRTVQKEVKQRQEAAESFKAAGRSEQAEAERAELGILEKYLPQQLSATELEALIEAALAQTGARSVSDLGLVMKTLQPQLAGRADGGQVAAAVRAKLQ